MREHHTAPGIDTNLGELNAIESHPMIEADQHSNTIETAFRVHETGSLKSVTHGSVVAVGESNFENVRLRNLVFIDKSMFIYKFLEHGSPGTILLRPRRFGKSLNLRMLKCFLDQKQKDPRKLFEGLEIMNNEDYVTKHMGQYPVVFLSLKDCVGETWQKMREHIWESLVDMCAPLIGRKDGGGYPQLAWSDLLESEYIQANPEFYPKGIKDIELGYVFSNLVGLLYRITKKQVIVLIDEFDTPMNVIMSSREDCKLRSNFFRNFLPPVLKDNDAVLKSLLVGVFEIRGGSILSGLNNLRVYTVANDPYFKDFFGFTEREVMDCIRSLRQKDGDAEIISLCKRIHAYYNGYYIDDSLIINPWSFMSCINRKFALKPYWIDTSKTQVLLETLKENGVPDSEILKAIEELFKEGGRIKVGKINPIHDVQHSGEMGTDRFLHFMCMTGYLTYKRLGKKDIEEGDATEKALVAEVWIPNKEVRQEWVNFGEDE